MKSTAQRRYSTALRVASSALAVALAVLVASCGGAFESQFTKRLSIGVVPQALTLEPGGTALLTLDVVCDGSALDAVVYFAPPLPSGVVVNRVSPANADEPVCTTPTPGSDDYTGQATFRIRVSASAPLGPAVLTAVAESRGIDTTFAIVDLTIAAPSGYGRNLLINPALTYALAQSGFPTAPGNWRGDAAASVPAEQGIDPRSAPSMLRFDATADVASVNNVSSQRWQIVDVGALAADIAAGRVRADASAWFNRVAGDASTDRRFDIRLLAFNGAAAGLLAAYNAGSQLAVQAASVQTAGNVWEEAALTMALPAGTTLLLVEIYAFEDVVNDGTSPEFAGHYADDISLVLTRQ